MSKPAASSRAEPARGFAAGLGRAEGLLASGSGPALGEARGLLESLDRGLLEALWRGESAREAAGAPAGLGGLGPFVFYRRALLRRLKARGVRLDPALLRSVCGGATSPRLILLVTHACQLRCGYCRVRRYPARMAPETADSAVRWLLGGLRSEVQLQFFGGEPLLNLPVVRRATALAERLAGERAKRVSFLLTTNGLAVTGEVLGFLREHRVAVEFSCDGGYRTQLSQRRAAGGRDYYAALASNLEALRRAGVSYQVISVVTPEGVGRLEEEFSTLARLGHRRIQLNYSLGRLWEPRAARRLREGLRRAAELAGELGLELVNRDPCRREPVVLNSELTVDCDGGVFRETGVCLEEDFREMKARFSVVRLKDAGLVDGYGSTQFDNLAQLVNAYSGHELRRVLLNNLRLGLDLARRPPWGRA